MNRTMTWIILAGLTVSLVGCGGSRISRANYDKITNGMTLEQVQGILGSPGEKASADVKLPGVEIRVGAEVYTWRDDGRKITVVFDDGKVSAKSQEGLP